MLIGSLRDHLAVKGWHEIEHHSYGSTVGVQAHDFELNSDRFGDGSLQ